MSKHFRSSASVRIGVIDTACLPRRARRIPLHHWGKSPPRVTSRATNRCRRRGSRRRGACVMSTAPVHPDVSAPIALTGRIVTMDDHASVIDRGVVYARDGAIAAVLPSSAPAPDGFAGVPRTPTRGTIYPGLIELHNHLPYDVLSLWQVPKQFGNRDQWSGPSTP